MKKPVLASLVLALPLALLLGLWLTLRSSGRGERASPGEVPARAPASTASAPALPPEPELTPAAEAAPPPTSAAMPADERRALASDASGRRIAGRVLRPEGAPSDDTLRVLALSRALLPPEVYGSDGLLAALAKGEKRELLLGTAPVARDGRFELALGTPSDVWLVLDGRFLYSAFAPRVPAGDPTCELAAELGGCLTGRLRLPAGEAGNAAALADIELRLGVDDESFSMSSLGAGRSFERSGRVDPEGRFELRALPPGPTQALAVRTAEFADATVKGLVFEAGRVRELELDLLHGATVSGLVRDEQGGPLEGAEITANESGMWGFPGRKLAEARSDALGRFRLAHIAPGKSLLLAKKEGYLEGEAVKLELRDEELREGLVLELGRGASIAGSVRFADGSAADGAEVQVSFDPEAMVGMGALNAARGAGGKATSDALGAFEVTGLGKGPFVVRASLERTAADEERETWQGKVAPVKPDTRDVVLTLNAPSALTGRVRNLAGEPVATFLLVATLDSGAVFLPGETRRERCQDPEGDFVLRGLENGKWKLQAAADGYGAMTPVEVVLPRAEATPVELVLAPAATISGKVLDPQGLASAGARVTLQSNPLLRAQRLRADTPDPETLSADDGTFRLDGLNAGSTTIHATREGFAASEPVSVETSPENPASGIVLRLRAGAVVTGEVYRADGKPAGGAKVIAQSSGMLDMSMKSADGAGLFRFEHLAPGSWTITALLEGSELDTQGSQAEVSASFLANMRFTMLQLEDGTEQHVVLGAPPKDPVQVSGVVRHGDHALEDGGLVSFLPEGSKGFESLKIAPLDGEGRYRTELSAPGTYVVTVQITGSGGPFQQNNVEFRETIPAAPEHRLDLDLPLGSVRGSVRGPDRKPLNGTRVTLTTDEGIRIGSLLGGHYSETTTDESGRFAFEYLHPGRYAVAAGGALFGGAFGGKSQAGRLVRTGLRVDEGRALDGVDFQLEEPGDIKGHVSDRGGAPVKDASIFVRDSSGHLLDRFSMITSGADGTFTYSGVSPGEYLVSARGQGQASAESAPVRVSAGASASVEVVLDAGTKLVVEVLDREGQPLAASLSVLDGRGREMVGMLGMSELAAGFAAGFDGKRQTVGPLPPGTYTVVAATAEGEKASRPVTLDGQPERKLTLRIR